MNKNSEAVLRSRYLMDDETCWKDVVDRLMREMRKIDGDERFAADCYNSTLNMDFIPGGRILRNLGKVKGSTMNCNMVELSDSIESIGEAIKSALIIWSYGGGVGMNFSSLRPKGTPLSTKGGKSSGLVSFLKAIDGIASTIESGGQRRAAGIALCDIGHPEVEDFIDVKLELGLLSHFNLSVTINDKFLKAVEENEKWNLGFGNKVYRTVDSNMLWEKLLSNMLKSAEPGIINWNTLSKNNTHYFSPIVGVNPCGEQPLPNWGSCDLGALNLANFLNGKQTDWAKLEACIKTSVRFLDNVIDLNYYPIDRLEIEAKNSRRIGLGVMGLADYLVLKGIRYGSEKSLQHIDQLFRFMRDKAYEASVELATIKKPFPMFDKVQYGHSSFIRKLPARIRIAIKENGIRNSNLLTCAPTGTTSLLPNVSSGIEPIIFKAYRRRDRIGERIYVHPLYRKFLSEGRSKDIDWFVDTTDLGPEDHLEVQATIQKYIDSGVSKTINLPRDADVSSLGKLLLEYIHDLKGVTVYRDGSREGQVYDRISEREVLEYLRKEEANGDLSEQDVQCPGGKCDL